MGVGSATINSRRRRWTKIFVIGESVQESAGAGANADMLSGRFAGALGRFNDVAERMLADA